MKLKYLCFLPGLVLAVLSGCTSSVEIIAHRGASYLAPENTMASVMLGWEKQADVEVDVHLSQDNRIVIIHDSTTKRTADQEFKVSETNYGVLSQLDAGSFKGERFAGEPIPLLADIIQTIPPQRKLYVEIKCGPEVLPILQRILNDSGKISQIVIIGFDLDTVVESKSLMPHIPTYWLKGTEKDKETKESIPHDPQLVQMISEKGLDGLDVHYAGVNTEFMNAVKAAGQKLYVWTVDDPKQAKHLIDLGVSGITTNRPEWLRNQLKN
ncbi:MAG: glycerophosphodiester phosphodiesterase [Planctomycetes bacterium]|nr:glycerophosphodiester phosphodiesterase [Planctomycetota bacterium]